MINEVAIGSKNKHMMTDTGVKEKVKSLGEVKFGGSDPKSSCTHEWRVIENFFTEFSRSQRLYIAYCVHCLESKAVEIELIGR